jgi:hypothetical protein
MSESKMMFCMRCDGRKKMYLMNGGYTHANMGGPQVDCPLCLGKGKIPVFDDAPEEVKKEAIKSKDKKQKECTDAKERREINDKT